MTSGNLIPTTVLKRKAIVYVRQSTQAQVQFNIESQRRQYELVDVARRWGFRKVEVIDEDLGRTASGAVERPGFERLVDDLCTGQVGAVLCLEASRLSRNGPDWHRLLELCGEVDARVIDLDGVYDPGLPNDRLLLGMKGSISEFELGVLRARMYEAARAKAQRGELRISVPFGYVWHRDYGLGFDPDMRLQETIRLIFARFRELGSARQVLISMTDDGVHFPRPSDGKKMVSFDWVPIRYRNVISILKNPFYAGAYVYGKSEKRTEIVDGRVRKSYGHYKPASEWAVVLKDHHEGYIGWSEYERNQELLAANAYGKAGGVKSGRGGRALLPGLISCGRCGRRLVVMYAGRGQGYPVYRCERGNLMMAQARCMSFNGYRTDAAVILTIHWHGGQHSQVRVRKPKSGEHGQRTPEEALAIMRSMATRWSDAEIAATLNRMGMQTGQGKTWTARRVQSLRTVHKISGYRSSDKNGEWLTMSDAAARLGVSHVKIRRFIRDGILPADQVMRGAPYQIRASDLEDERIKADLARKTPRRINDDNQESVFSAI